MEFGYPPHDPGHERTNGLYLFAMCTHFEQTQYFKNWWFQTSYLEKTGWKRAKCTNTSEANILLQSLLQEACAMRGVSLLLILLELKRTGSVGLAPVAGLSLVIRTFCKRINEKLEPGSISLLLRAPKHTFPLAATAGDCPGKRRFSADIHIEWLKRPKGRADVNVYKVLVRHKLAAIEPWTQWRALLPSQRWFAMQKGCPYCSLDRLTAVNFFLDISLHWRIPFCQAFIKRCITRQGVYLFC